MSAGGLRLFLELPFLTFFVLFLVVCPQGTVLADQGDWSVGGAAAIGLPSEDGSLPLRFEASTRLGLSDWFGLEVGAGLHHAQKLGVQAELGVVASADVFQWVPEALISGVVLYRGDANSVGGFEAGVRGQLRARYFTSLRSSISLGVGGTWLSSESRPFVRLGWQSLFN